MHVSSWGWIWCGDECRSLSGLQETCFNKHRRCEGSHSFTFTFNCGASQCWKRVAQKYNTVDTRREERTARRRVSLREAVRIQCGSVVELWLGVLVPLVVNSSSLPVLATTLRIYYKSRVPFRTNSFSG